MHLLGGWDIYHLKCDSHGHASSSNLFLYNIRGPNISQTIWDIRFQDARLPSIEYSGNLIPHFDLLISRLPDIIQRSFCTPDGAIDLIFQMNYVPAFDHVPSQRN